MILLEVMSGTDAYEQMEVDIGLYAARRSSRGNSDGLADLRHQLELSLVQAELVRMAAESAGVPAHDFAGWSATLTAELDLAVNERRQLHITDAEHGFLPIGLSDED